MMVIYLPVKFEFDWSNRFKVRVRKRKMWTDRQTDGQTDVGHINLIGGLVTRNPPKNDYTTHIITNSMQYTFNKIMKPDVNKYSTLEIDLRLHINRKCFMKNYNMKSVHDFTEISLCTIQYTGRLNKMKIKPSDNLKYDSILLQRQILPPLHLKVFFLGLLNQFSFPYN